MQFTILFLIAISKSIQNANCANVPTFTATNRQATVRFPNEQDNGLKTTPKPPEEFLIDSPIEAATNNSDWTTTTIKPTKSTTTIQPTTLEPIKSTTKSNSVQVIGNYSIAVQHASKVKKENGAEEIIEQNSSLLEVLNYLRQLPREKLAEIYFGAEGNQNSASTTESVLEFLNDLREQQKTTPTSTVKITTTTEKPRPTTAFSTTVSSSTTTSTTRSTSTEKEADLVTILYEEDLIDSTEKIVPDQDITPNVQDDLLKSDNVTSIDNKITNSSGNSNLTLAQKPSLTPPILVTNYNSNNLSQTPSILTTPKSYEFTDYPPPLPPPGPPLSDYPRINRDQNTDTSFAVGVAVGILACVVVLGGGATWCVCRRTCSFSTRNVYATMEAEEIPRAFTKPGPPVILPDEFDQVSKANNHGSSIGKAPYSSELDANRVTEL